ncbi:MAG: hypothetical protein ACK5JI_00345 [Azonexus sp.]
MLALTHLARSQKAAMAEIELRLRRVICRFWIVVHSAQPMPGNNGPAQPFAE